MSYFIPKTKREGCSGQKGNMSKFINKNPRGIKQLYAFGEKRSIDLSLSENPLGCSPLVAKKLKELKCNFNDYPKPNGEKLKKALAQKLNCKTNQVFISNGSEAIIDAIPKVFAQPNDQVIIPALTFPLFNVCCRLSKLDIKFAQMTDELGINLNQIIKLINKKTKLIFICNPNNPTGAVISRSELTEFIQKVPPSILIIVDEANIEFASESLIELAKTKSNLMILRTFSKGFGLASLRVGFALANQCLIEKLEEETTPFPTSNISEELAIVALNDDQFIAKTKLFVANQRQLLQKELVKLGFKVFPSQANNLFVKLPDEITTQAFSSTLKNANISVVKGSSFTGFDDRFFRLSPRLEKTNQAFLRSITELVNKGKL